MRSLFRPLSAGILLFAALSLLPGQDVRKVTLPEAIDLALKNNRALEIAADKIAEMQSATHVARSSYFPQVTNSSSYLHFTQTDVLHLSAGSFGSFPGLGALPASTLNVAQGELNNEISRTQFSQPISQLLKIHDAHRIAQADENASREDLRGLQNQVAVIVRQLYYGLLTVQLEQEAASKQSQFAQTQLAEMEQDVSKGNALDMAVIGAKASAMEARQNELATQIRHSDLEAQFNNVVGFAPGTRLDLEDKLSPPLQLPSRQECIMLAQSAAPSIKSAEQAVHKTQAAVDAAKAEYIPDISFFARHDYQDGVPFLFHNYGVVGFNLTYTLFDGGKKRAVLKEREAQRAQALDNLQRLKDEAGVDVLKALNRIEQSRSMVDVARQVVALREEADRLASVQLQYSAILSSQKSEALSNLAKRVLTFLKSELEYAESQAELSVIIGRLPR